MTLPRLLLGDYPVRPWCELGVGDTRVVTGQARWSVDRWNNPAALWAGSEPTWLDVSCEVIAATSTSGRVRIIDRFAPGSAEVTFRNVDGWADLTGHAVPPAALTLRPGRQIRFGVDTPTGRHVLFRGYLDVCDPTYVPYGTDTVTVAAVDALAEVGRAKLTALATAVGDGETGTARIARILDAALWPANYRDLAPTSLTVQGTRYGAQAVDLLGVTADSVGGAVFGDLAGRIVFRPRDWQTFVPGTPPDGTIGNVDPGTPGHEIPGTPAVPAHLAPAVGTVTVPYTAGTAVTVTADPADAASYWRVVGANAEVGRNPAGTLYPGPIRSLTLTQTPPPGADVLLEPFNDFTSWTQAGTPAISAARTGTGCALGGATSSVRYTIPTGSRHAVATVGVAYRVSNLAANRHPLSLFAASAGSPVGQTTLRVTTTGAVAVLRGGVTGTVIGTSAAAGLVPVNTFVYLEVQATLGDGTAGAVTVRVNGVEVLALTGVDTNANADVLVYDAVTLPAAGSGITSLSDDLYVTMGAGAPFKGSITIPPAVPAVGDPGFSFAAADYPGTGTSYVDPRGETWTLSAPGAVVPTVPEVPPVWVPGTPGDVCPSAWDLAWPRSDVAAVVRMARADGTGVTVTDQTALGVLGPEPFARTDLITFNTAELTTLANRALQTRGLATMPRVAGVTLDAARDPGDGTVCELMATARPERPSRYRCRLRESGRDVFDAELFVTQVSHTINASGRWFLDLGLDVAAPFAAQGGRWDSSYWDRSVWSQLPALLAEARRLHAELIGAS